MDSTDAYDAEKAARRHCMERDLRAIDIGVTVMAVAFVIFRFWARFKSLAGIGVDDYLIVVALFIAFANLAMNLIMIENGLGLQASEVEIYELMNIGKAIYADEVIYVVNLALIKVSILVMYCRVFALRSFKVAAWILSIITVIWSLMFIFICIFQCSPIERAWNPTVPGTCLYLRGIFIGNAIPNILTDVIILLMPMYHVWQLKVRFIQRLTLTAIFFLGCFVIFASIYRFVTVLQLDQNNISYTLKTPTTWSHVEVVTAIVSACLPTMRPLLTSFLNLVGMGSADRSTNPSGGWRSGLASNTAHLSDKKLNARDFSMLKEDDQWSQSNKNRSDDNITLHHIKVQTDIEMQNTNVDGKTSSGASGKL